VKSPVEYADYDFPIYGLDECTGRCMYCVLNADAVKRYAKRIRRIDVEKTLVRAERAARRGARIIVSYLVDPYPPQEAYERRTRRLLSILANGGPRGARILVLTRNPGLALRDADLMWRGKFWLGTTISCIPSTPLEEEECGMLEDGVPSVTDRLDALARAKMMDIHTWLNVEPVHALTDIDAIIELTHSYVDAYVISPLTDPAGAEYIPPENYGEAARRAAEKLRKLGKPYIIRGLGEPAFTWVA